MNGSNAAVNESSEIEKGTLDALWSEKSKVPYENTYFSTAVERIAPELGTIEADVSGKFGRWRRESFRAERLAELAAQVVRPKQILDIGGATYSPLNISTQ